MKRLNLLLIVLMLLHATCYGEQPRLRPADWATPVISSSLENWYRVDRRLYRSEQPDRQGMAEAEKMGIKRVLNLRKFHGDEDDAEQTGLKLHKIAMDAGDIREEQIVQALKIIVSSDEPILVHCWHGADRTGTVVAMYRILFQGWTKEAAIDELAHGGYGYHAIYDNIPAFIRAADIEALRKQLNAEPPR